MLINKLKPAQNGLGFSLIEALFVILIVGTLASFGISYYFQISQAATLKNLASDIQATLHTSRSLALNGIESRTFCLTHNSLECDSTGIYWMAFNDINKNKKRDEADEPIILRRNWNTSQVKVSTTLKDGIAKFRHNGMGGATAGSLYFCQLGTKNAYKVVISMIGKVRIEQLEASEEDLHHCTT